MGVVGRIGLAKETMAETTAQISMAGCPTAMKFSGKREDWAAWKVQAGAVLRYQGCGSTLKPEFKNQLPESEAAYELLDETDADDKKMIIAFRKNLRGVALVQSCMEDPTIMQLVLSAIDDSAPEFPGGLMYKVWVALVKKF